MERGKTLPAHEGTVHNMSVDAIKFNIQFIYFHLKKHMRMLQIYRQIANTEYDYFADLGVMIVMIVTKDYPLLVVECFVEYPSPIHYFVYTVI